MDHFYYFNCVEENNDISFALGLGLDLERCSTSLRILSVLLVTDYGQGVRHMKLGIGLSNN